MRTNFQYVLVILLITTITSLVAAQESDVDRISLKFSDPSKSGSIQTSLINGGITVTGYDGDEVIIEASTRSTTLSDHDYENDRKTKGMIKIPFRTTGLEVEEDNNEMEISAVSWKRTIDLNIRTPKKTSLKLHCVNAGDIVVENVEGEIDVNNINGKVTLTNVSGTVVAHALNKDLIVTMDKVDPKNSMSFSTLNGDIDVTMPSNIKADVHLKSDNGEIYSDFEIKIENNPKKIIKENGREKGGRYKVEIEQFIYGKINGGGPEYRFKSFNGDIFIRKNK